MEKELLAQMELATPIGGMNAMDYMALLIDRNDKDQIALEKGKLTIGILKQMNNRSRVILDAYKYALKKAEFDKGQKTETE